MESASAIAAALSSLESVRIASGKFEDSGRLSVFSVLPASAAESFAGIGLKVGNGAPEFGQVRLLWPVLWHMLHLRDIFLGMMGEFGNGVLKKER